MEVLSVIAFASSVTLLFPLTCILRNGSHVINEPSLPILIFEIITVFSFIAYSLYCLIKLAKMGSGKWE